MLDTASAELIRQSLDTVLQGILIIDRDLRIVVANRRYVEMFELHPDIVAPGTCFEAMLLHMAQRGEYGPGDPRELVEQRLAPVRDRRSWALDRSRPDGTSLYITGNMLPDGGYVFTFTDVTERVKAAARLEHMVAARTVQYRQAKEDAEQALQQVTAAHEQLSHANALVQQSLTYASRLQASMLPDAGAHDGLLRDLAVVWQPVDAVGGDLYWFGRYGDQCLVALLDCTGHGVPGAFMAAIAGSTLDSILRHQARQAPGAILAQLNRLVRSALRQDRPDAASNDGLDAAICLVDPRRRRLTFAGANLPLLIQTDDGIDLVKGDRHSLGYRDSRTDFVFTDREIPLTSSASFYLFSDGVIDQLGGPRGQLFGRRRLRDALLRAAGLPLSSRLAQLCADLDAYRGGESRLDDLTIVGFAPALTDA